MGICQSESHRAPPLATLQLATDGTYQKGYFRQPAGLVWHDCRMRVVTLNFLFKSTPLYGVVLLKINFKPTVCRFKADLWESIAIAYLHS